MSVITFSHKGNFNHLENFLQRTKHSEYIESILTKYGDEGVIALSQATPKRTGKTASSWRYDTYVGPFESSIVWSNTNENDGCNIAVLIQYGHGTGDGAYVEGIDYINPTMKGIFDQIANAAWKEVTK